MNTIANRNALSRHVASLALLSSFAVFVALGNATAVAQGMQLYRWVDEQGNVNYTDKIPASQAEKGHIELSDDGMRVRTIPPAKTAEQIQRERELERLRAQQQRLIDQQKAEDRVLLRTFRNSDDLIMVRDGKLSALDVMIQVTKGNVRRQQDWLTKLRAEAAELERAGEPVTDQLQGRIAAAERSLNQAMGTILERERQKQEIRETFARDLKRFQQLKDIPEEVPSEEQSQQPSELANLIECDDVVECERMWQQALGYLRRHATVPIETAGDDVAMTQPPLSIKDIALTVSRIWNPNRSSAVIFLDVQCRSYSSSADSCRTEPRRDVLNAFRATLEAGDIGDMGDMGPVQAAR
jgi:hypothetical protein